MSVRFDGHPAMCVCNSCRDIRASLAPLTEAEERTTQWKPGTFCDMSVHEARERGFLGYRDAPLTEVEALREEVQRLQASVRRIENPDSDGSGPIFPPPGTFYCPTDEERDGPRARAWPVLILPLAVAVTTLWVLL